MKKSIQWTWRDVVILLIVPAELLLGSLINTLGVTQNQMIATIAAFFIFFSGFLTAVLLRRDLLIADFRRYKQHLLKNIGLSLLGAVSFGIIIFLGRMLLMKPTGSLALGSYAAAISPSTTLSILISGVIPVLAPFTEEIVFRHELFYKWKDSKNLRVVMLLVSSILFGLVHYNNYSGTPIMMIPLMVAGLALAGLYYWSKNIWVNIMAHFFYNAVLSLIPSIFLIIVQLISG
ncbi:hypothetical protein NRIC_31350 [Enterococcus florum]|uniref:CAAX prenyl protease 2/Lysostaphin resistance protein A-like domain-containing protein n=1 Tax=Enterococcus florum TaxID=2480627 RepID=A0A4P5PEW6_9ENTE|nr:type II CAAX endopeptidase family protein [Enterococcus florum]GCF95244.1 hypothetical protein NRIC_31350 [Enterococcus florum]